MPIPGSEVTIIDELPASSDVGDTGTAFMVGVAERGPVGVPVEVRSPRSLSRLFGGPVSYSSLAADADSFFSRGGTRLFVSRVVGPAAAVSTVSLPDGASGSALKVDASSPGDWGDDLSVKFTIDSADITAEVSLDGKVVEISGPKDGKTGIIAWSETSDYVRFTDGGGGNATAATVDLTGGSDDRQSITDTHWKTALAAFGAELGAGQVLAPGVTSLAAALLEHAADRNRFALVDCDNVAGTALTAAGVARATGNGRYGTMVAPTVDGKAASAFVAGRIAYTDRAAGPGQYAAGSNYGELGNVRADVDYTEPERAELNEAGIQVIRNMGTGCRVYGFRTLADPSSPYVEAAHARVLMALRGELEQIIEQYVLRKIDGRGHLFAQLEGDLAGVCETYFRRGDLYGETAGDAYRVDAGSSVNTPELVAQRKLSAAVAIRVAPGAERVYLTITKAATADTL